MDQLPVAIPHLPFNWQATPVLFASGGSEVRVHIASHPTKSANSCSPSSACCKAHQTIPVVSSIVDRAYDKFSFYLSQE